MSEGLESGIGTQGSWLRKKSVDTRRPGSTPSRIVATGGKRREAEVSDNLQQQPGEEEGPIGILQQPAGLDRPRGKAAGLRGDQDPQQARQGQQRGHVLRIATREQSREKTVMAEQGQRRLPLQAP